MFNHDAALSMPGEVDAFPPGISFGRASAAEPHRRTLPPWVGISFDEASAVKPLHTTLAHADRVLAGMIDKGLGRSAICAYLEMKEETLLERVAELDLPTPAELPFRPRQSPRYWSVAQSQMLIALWTQNIRPAQIAEHIGRSTGSVRYKSRSIGLWRRGWSELVGLPPQPERGSRQQHTDDKNRQLAAMWFANLHPSIMAILMGMSSNTVSTQCSRRGMPARRPEQLTKIFDPSTLVRTGKGGRDFIYNGRVYKEKQCKWDKKVFYEARTAAYSPAAKNSPSYQSALACGIV